MLVNKAGLMLEGDATDCGKDDWQRTLPVKFSSPFLLIKYAVPHPIETSSSIVNIGSIVGLGSNPRHPACCASKVGLHGLTRAVAADGGRTGAGPDIPLASRRLIYVTEMRRFRTGELS